MKDRKPEELPARKDVPCFFIRHSSYAVARLCIKSAHVGGCRVQTDTMHRTTSEEWVESTSRQLAEELKSVGQLTISDLDSDLDSKDPQCELGSSEERERLAQLRDALDPALLEQVYWTIISGI